MFFNERWRDEMDINITNQNINTNMNDNFNYNEMDGYGMDMPIQQQMGGSVMSPIVEPGRERVVNRTFVHEVPHVG